MKALLGFHRDLVELYSYEVEVTAALHQWTEFIRRMSDLNETTTPDSLFLVWRGESDCSGELYQYAKTIREMLEASEEGGRNVLLHRNAVVALTYALWEDEYRQLIAKETGLGSKDEVKSDVFQDLNKYRQAVLHVNGRLDREPEVIKFFRKGDFVSFTKDHMYLLFLHLIDELNRIGKEYYAASLSLHLNKHFPEL